MSVPLSQLRAVYEDAVHQAIADAIKETNGNVSAAARLLDVSHALLCKLIKSHGLAKLAGELRMKAGWGRVVKEGPRKGQVMGNPKRAKSAPPGVA